MDQETILLKKNSGTPEDWISDTHDLTLNPTRSCSNMWWFYAGDRMSIVDKNILKNIKDGEGIFLNISAQAFSVGTWKIQLSISDEVFLHHTFSEKDLEKKYLRLPLWGVLEGRGDVKVSVTGDGYMTISEISLGN